MKNDAKKDAAAAEARQERFDKARRFERRLALIEMVVPFLGVIAAIVLLWGRGISPVDLGLLVGMYTATLIGIGTGFHRYFAHRSFETTESVKLLLAILGSMAGQGPIVWWTSIHRFHHAHSDKHDDPHSPHLHGGGWHGRLRGLWYAQVGWVFSHKMKEGEGRRQGMDLLVDPTVSRVDRLHLFWVFLGLALPAAAGALWSPGGAFSGLLWGGLVRMFLVHHSFWSINSICHVYGRAPFRCNDRSRNNPWVGLVAFGDGWHNNHHAFPASPVHGLEWWQFDLNGYVILLLRSLGLAWDLKIPTKSQQNARRVGVLESTATSTT